MVAGCALNRCAQAALVNRFKRAYGRRHDQPWQMLFSGAPLLLSGCPRSVSFVESLCLCQFSRWALSPKTRKGRFFNWLLFWSPAGALDDWVLVSCLASPFQGAGLYWAVVLVKNKTQGPKSRLPHASSQAPSILVLVPVLQWRRWVRD